MSDIIDRGPATSVAHESSRVLQEFTTRAHAIARELGVQFLECIVLHNGQIHRARWQPNLTPGAAGLALEAKE